MVPKDSKPMERDIVRPKSLREGKDIEQILEALASETNDQRVDILARRLIDAFGKV